MKSFLDKTDVLFYFPLAKLDKKSVKNVNCNISQNIALTCINMHYHVRMAGPAIKTKN